MDNSVFQFGNRLVINVELASKIGLNKAIVLQQINYWIDKNIKSNNNYFENRYWVYKSISRWQKEDFPFWSVDTIKRIITELVNDGLVLSNNFNGKYRTKWYTLDYDKITTEYFGDFRQRQLNTTTEYEQLNRQLNITTEYEQLNKNNEAEIEKELLVQNALIISADCPVNNSTISADCPVENFLVSAKCPNTLVQNAPIISAKCPNTLVQNAPIKKEINKDTNKDINKRPSTTSLDNINNIVLDEQDFSKVGEMEKNTFRDKEILKIKEQIEFDCFNDVDKETVNSLVEIIADVLNIRSGMLRINQTTIEVEDVKSKYRSLRHTHIRTLLYDFKNMNVKSNTYSYMRTALYNIATTLNISDGMALAKLETNESKSKDVLNYDWDSKDKAKDDLEYDWYNER